MGVGEAVAGREPKSADDTAARGARPSDRLAQASRDSIEAGSKSFAVASRLFDPLTRESARHFYAWCRQCDDVIDGQVSGFLEARRNPVGVAPSSDPGPSAPLPAGFPSAFRPPAPRASLAQDEVVPLVPRSPEEPGVSKREEPRARASLPSSPTARLAALEAETRAALAGQPTDTPAFAALARVAHMHRLPGFVPLDILGGFRMDVEGRRYRTLDDLFGYCYGVAGAVGVGMAIIMGVDPGDRATLDRACDLGLAFQLTNIARDVIDDARAGRVYLPAELFGRDAVDAAFILDDANRPAVVAAAHALVELAERYYASARIGIAKLPWRSAWAVATALRVYREIGRRVRRAPNPWAERQSVPGWRKLMHVAGAGAAPALFRLRLDPDTPRAGLWTRADR